MKEREEIFFDFGFTTQDENDIIANSDLHYDVETTRDRVVQLETLLKTMNKKVHTIYDRISPLLNNLLKDADEKPIINWPNRKEKITEFQKILKKIVDEADQIIKGES
jgi:hypothetical protein